MAKTLDRESGATGFRVHIATKEEYDKVLSSWAAFTLSSPEPRWRGPGFYENGGYMDDDSRPVATLEKKTDAC